eukprot:8445652-Pyramimonas_sp.AAC.1
MGSGPRARPGASRPPGPSQANVLALASAQAKVRAKGLGGCSGRSRRPLLFRLLLGLSGLPMTRGGGPALVAESWP